MVDHRRDGVGFVEHEAVAQVHGNADDQSQHVQHHHGNAQPSRHNAKFPYEGGLLPLTTEAIETHPFTE